MYISKLNEILKTVKFKVLSIHGIILYTYKILRDVIFEVFTVNWPSAKFSSLKFHWLNFDLHHLKSRILSDPRK